MTEAEWLAAADPIALANRDRARLTARKLRLFCPACCRRYTAAIEDPQTAAAAELLERSADGLVGESDRLYPNTFQHNSLVCDMWGRAAFVAALQVADRIAGDIGRRFNSGPKRDRAVRAELVAQAALFRDVFGNPFRPVSDDPAWRTSSALAMSHQMYESRDFAAMPILADALQDAGCEEQDVLAHCRAGGTHVRGCRVVDLLLGKA